MRSPLLLGLLGALSAGALSSIEAQTYRYELGASVSTNYYLGDLGRRGFLAPQRPGLALELRRRFGLRWALSSELALRGLHGAHRYALNSFPEGSTAASFSRTLGDLALGGEYHFFAYSDRERYLGTRSWTPFLGAGLALGAGQTARTLQLIPSLYLRLGLKVQLASRWALHASWTLRRTMTDQLEGKDLPAGHLANPFGIDPSGSWKGKDSYASWSIGLSYRLAPQRRYLCE